MTRLTSDPRRTPWRERPQWPRWLALMCTGLAVMLFAGCRSAGGYAGALSGIAVGAVSSNPAVGVGVGIAVKAATDDLSDTVFRNMQRNEQDRIAALAGSLPVGQTAAWNIHHVIPFNDESGHLQVVADIDNVLAPCRMVLFSVIGGKKSAPTEQWFSTQTCRSPDGTWKWAAAEPSTKRWGNLQ